MNILACIRLCIKHGSLGGMELAAHATYKGLARNGCDVTVLTTSLTDLQVDAIEFIVDSVKYISLPMCEPKIYSDDYHKQVVAYFSSNSIKWNIIHSTSAGASSLLNNNKKIPVVATWHGTFLEEQLDKFCKYMYVDEKNINPAHVESFITGVLAPFLKDGVKNYNQYDHHFVISDFMKVALESYGIDPLSITVVPNSISDNFFNMSGFSKSKARSFLSLPDSDKITLGFVGRLTKLKGNDIFINAINQLDPLKYDVVFFGAGDDLSSREIKLDYQFISVSHTDMPYAYRSIDVLINPTLRFSGFDLTVLESLASDIFCICSNFPQYQTFFNNSKRTKFSIFEKANVDSLISAINRIDFLGLYENPCVLKEFETNGIYYDELKRIASYE